MAVSPAGLVLLTAKVPAFLLSLPSFTHVATWQRLADPNKGPPNPSKSITIQIVPGATSTGHTGPLASSSSGRMSVTTLTYPNGRGNRRRDHIRVVHPLELVQHDGSRRILRAHPRLSSIVAPARETRRRCARPCPRRWPPAPPSIRD